MFTKFARTRQTSGRGNCYIYAVGSRRKHCVLLAEDDPGLRQLLDEVLTNDGFKVVSAENGRDALREANEYRGVIDLLVTDVEMPQVDGFDLQEQLRQLRPGTKLLVISGALHSDIKGEDFPLLRKPFLPTEFREKVRQILAH